jgi:thioredoxin-like negative regulator of GroEL
MDALQRAARVRRLRPWLAAAAALLVAVAGAAVWLDSRPHTVTLRAIHQSPRIEMPVEFAIPPALATYRPVADGKVNWMSDLADARVVAKTASRPLFVFVYHPQCPLCIQLDRGALKDRALLAEVEKFVPVRIDVMKAPDEVEAWLQGGWPYFGAQSADGAHLEDFPGMHDAKALTALLAKNAGTASSAAPWSVSNELAAAYEKAEAAREAKRYGEAYEAYRAMQRVMATLGPSQEKAVEPFRNDVAVRMWHMNDEAWRELKAAQELATTDEAAGARSLSEAAERFRGTPYGLDLAEVEQELRATGRFPVVIESNRRGDRTH